MEKGWADEHGDEEEDPPEEGEGLCMLVYIPVKIGQEAYEEGNCQVSHEANAPQVIWRDSWIIWAEITTAVCWSLVWNE